MIPHLATFSIVCKASSSTPVSFAAATAEYISSILHLLSSLSMKSLSAGIVLALSGLNLSPNEMYNPAFVSCAACMGLPRNPWTIHVCEGFASRCSAMSLSCAFTQCTIRGLRSASDNRMCARNTSSCSSRDAGDLSMSSPHSPMATTLSAFAHSATAASSLSHLPFICQGCIPMEIFLSGV